MTEETKLDNKQLLDIRRASTDAAMALLNKTQEDGQVRVVAEKIAIQAMGVAIGQGRFALPNRPQSHGVRVEARSKGAEAGRGA